MSLRDAPSTSAEAVLTSAIDEDTRVIPCDPDNLMVGDYLQIHSERLGPIESIGGSSVTIEVGGRGYTTSDAAAHAAGSKIFVVTVMAQGIQPDVAADFDIDFTNLPDGTLVADPGGGYYIKSTGNGLPQISGGYMVNSVANEVGYAMVSARRRQRKMQCTFRLVAGSGTDAAAVTIALVSMRRSQSSVLPDLAHPIITRTGWAIQKFVEGDPDNIVLGNFATPLALDTNYTMTVEMDFDTGVLTLTDPYGDKHESSDSDLFLNWGRGFFFEIVEQSNSPKGKIKRVRAWADSSTAIEAPKAADFWLPTDTSDGTVTVAENIEKGRFQALSDLAVLTSGVMFEVGGMVLPAGVPINRILISSGLTGAVAPTNQWLALLDRAGRVLAVTEDREDEPWPASTIKGFNLDDGFIPEGPTPVMVCPMVKASTVPTLLGITVGTNYGWVLYDYVAGSAAATGLTTPIPVNATRRRIVTPSAGIPYVAAA